MNLLHRLLDMDPDERITASEALESPYFDSLKPQKESRISSPIFEKHRALSSTHRGPTDKQMYVGANSKHSAKENCNPYTQYGKFRNIDYTNVIRSTSKGKKKLAEAKYHSKNSNSFLTNSTNQLASTSQHFNFEAKKKSIANTKKGKYKQQSGNSTHYTNHTNQNSNTSMTINHQHNNSGFSYRKDFAINTTNNFHRGSRRKTEETLEDGTLRNSSLKRDESKNKNKQNNMKMFQISEESEYKASPHNNNKHIPHQPSQSHTLNNNFKTNNIKSVKRGNKYAPDENMVIYDEEIINNSH